MTYTVFTLEQRPDLIDETDEMASTGWPEFMLHDPVANRCFGRLYEDFLDFQSVLLNEEGRVVACANSVPITWDGRAESLPLEGWDAALQQGIDHFRAGISPDTLSAIQVVVAKDYLGKGLSQQAIQTMRAAAQRHNLKALVAPVRPNWKHRYPLTPMERYVEWRDSKGGFFDPWLRTHQRLGATFLRVCPRSMTITGSIEEWERWTGMSFPESDSYIVPGALAPVEIDCDHNSGRYVEPNVWMLHKLSV